jgi:hypothetical protein
VTFELKKKRKEQLWLELYPSKALLRFLRAAPERVSTAGGLFDGRNLFAVWA